MATGSSQTAYAGLRHRLLCVSLRPHVIQRRLEVREFLGKSYPMP
jgi:hypothetical protein